MPRIKFSFESDGASGVKRDLESIAAMMARLQSPKINTSQYTSQVKSTVASTVQLAQSLKVSYGEAQKFAQSLGTSEAIAQKAVSTYQQLSAVNATSSEKFRALSTELGLSSQQYQTLETSVHQATQAQQLAADQAQKLAIAQQVATQAIAQTSQALVQLSADSLRNFADFDRAIRTTQAVSRASAEDIEGLRSEVIRLGLATSKTPQEIAEVSTAFTRAGFTADQASAALSGVVLASEASGESLTIVGDIIAKTVRQFGLTADESTRVADVLTIAANASNVSVSSLGQSLKFAGTQGAAAGQDLETVVTLLSALGDVGLQGGIGGRNLAAALRQLQQVSAASATEIEGLQGASDNALAAFDALQVSFRGTDGEIRPLLEVLPEIKTQLATLSPPDQDAVLQAIFGTEGSRAIVGILSKTDEELAALASTIRDADGAAAAASETILGGLGGSLDILQSSVDTAKINFGEFLSGGVKPLVDGLASLLNVYNSAPAPIQLLINVTGALTTSLLALTAALQIYEALQIKSALISARKAIAQTAELVATKALALAQNTLAIATGRANAATLASAANFGLIAAAAASIGTVVQTFQSIESASLAANDAIRQGNEALAELREIQRDLATTSEEQSQATQSLIEKNLENFAAQRGVLAKLRDSVTEFINVLNPGNEEGGLGDLVSTETGAIREQARTLEQLGGDIDEVFNEIQNTDISTLDPQELEKLNQVIQVYSSNVERLAPLNAANDSTIQSLNITLEASRNLLQGNTEALDANSDAASRNAESLALAANAAKALVERRAELQSRTDQAAFDLAEFEIQQRLDQQRRDEDRAFQQQQQQQTSDFAAYERSLDEQLQATQEQRTEAFNESQRQAQLAFDQRREQRTRQFEQEIADLREQRQAEIDAVQQRIDRELALAGADNARERADLTRQFAEQDAQAQLRAQLEAQTGINELRDQLEADIQAQRDQFQLQEQERDRQFQLNQQEKEKQFQDQLAVERLALEAQIAEQKRQLEAELQAQQDSYDAAKAVRDFQLQQEAQARQAAFNDQQNLRQLETASRVKEILESIRIPSPTIPGTDAIVPALRDGGSVEPGQLYQVHRDEFIIPRSPGTVLNQRDSRDLVRRAIAPIPINRQSLMNAPLYPARTAIAPMAGDSTARKLDAVEGRLATISRQLQKLDPAKLAPKTQQNNFTHRPSALDYARLVRW